VYHIGSSATADTCTSLVPAYPGCPGKEATKWVSCQCTVIQVTGIQCYTSAANPIKIDSLLFYSRCFGHKRLGHFRKFTKLVENAKRSTIICVHLFPIRFAKYL